MSIIAIGTAFIGGIVSFLSPCILPIVPGFLAYLAGTSAEQDAVQKSRREIFFASLFFVLGFAVIFSLLGIALNTILTAVAYSAQRWLSRIGGALVIFFGLYLTKLITVPFLDRPRTIRAATGFSSRHATSFFFGAAFAVGWTPCVGAALGGILSLAAAEPASAFILLISYSVGLGIPFLLVGVFTSQASAIISKNAASFKYVSVAFGFLLIIMGVLVFTQSLNLIANFSFLNAWLLR